MGLHIDPMPDDQTLQAAMYGPMALAGQLGSSDLGDDKIYLGYGPVPKGEPVAAPRSLMPQRAHRVAGCSRDTVPRSRSAPPARSKTSI